jgi:hypothetical protein
MSAGVAALVKGAEQARQRVLDAVKRAPGDPRV